MLYKNGYYKQHLAVLKARVDNARREFNEAFEMLVASMYSPLAIDERVNMWLQAYEVTFAAYLEAVKEYHKYRRVGNEVVK